MLRLLAASRVEHIDEGASHVMSRAPFDEKLML
jgi:hypothetical protein